MDKINAVITGVGGFVPDDVLTNEDLSKMVDTTDEWIMTRVGIKERRILKDPTKSSGYMGAQAVSDLLRKTGIDPLSVEGVITLSDGRSFTDPTSAANAAQDVTDADGWRVWRVGVRGAHLGDLRDDLADRSS